MFTRAQYIAAECSHNEYYSQFINPENSAYVLGRLSKQRLLAECKTKSLNEINLYEIDRIFGVKSMTDAKLLISVGETWSQATQVCIVKAIITDYVGKNNIVLV